MVAAVIDVVLATFTGFAGVIALVDGVVDREPAKWFAGAILFVLVAVRVALYLGVKISFGAQ